MAILTLFDLVSNHTMSPGMAATLASAAEERRSLLFCAIPRLAGKSTVMHAALAHVLPGTAVHSLRRSHGPALGIPAPSPASPAYLTMSEIAPTGFDDYLWADEVRTVFDAVGQGFALATALHAPGIDEAFEVITRMNGVPDDQASRIDLFVYIRSLGHWTNPTRRVVERVYEVDSVRDGQVEARQVHHWDEASNRFESDETDRRIGAEGGRYDRWLREFAAR